jgi:hypothetical protein
VHSDSGRWRRLINAAGSSADVLALKDSQSGDPSLAFDQGSGSFLPYHVFDFWLNLALCHALLVDTSDDAANYQVTAGSRQCRSVSVLRC